MQRSAYILIILSAALILNSCRSSRSVVTSSAGEPDAAAYIEKYKDLAVSEMKRTGVPASITLAQGMIESDCGRSRLAREANNHFGIKCHNGWNGPTIRHSDDRRNECFRKYRRPEESFRDHSDFLRTGSRYVSLFDLPSTDYRAWARGLKRAGYATNPDYANMLMRKIDENNLHQYDLGYRVVERPVAQVLPSKPDSSKVADGKPVANGTAADGTIAVSARRAPRVMENNRIQYIIVREGETLKSIEEEFSLLKWEITRYNDISGDFSPVPGQILYLQPKRDKAEPGKEIHVTAEGETLYQISQTCGVKLRKLREYNMMNEGEEPVAGQKIWLRTMKTAR